MPRLAQTVTQTVTVEQKLTISPKQQLTLRKHQLSIQRQRKKVKEAEADIEKSVGEVEDILAELGVEELEFEGFRSKIVAGTRSVFDPDLFVKKGGNLAIYNAAKVDKPVKAYVKVTPPSEKEE